MNQMLMDKTEQRWQMFVTFAVNLYLFFLCSTKWNAGVSISAGLVGVAILFFYGYKRKKIQWPNKLFLFPYFLFMGAVLLASFLTGDGPSIKVSHNFLSYSLPFWLLYLVLVQKKNSFIAEIQWGAVAGTWILNVQVIYQLFALPKDNRITAGFASANNFAMCLESILPLLWVNTFMLWRHYKNNQTRIAYFHLSFITAVVTTFFLFLSGSRGGIAGFLIGLFSFGVVYILQNMKDLSFKKKISALLLSVCICVNGIFTAMLKIESRSYDGERILLLRSAYAMWQDHKVYGVGFQRWNQVYRAKYILPEAKEPTLSLPHNNIANFFSGTGTIGGIGYVSFILATVSLLLKKINDDPNNISAKMMLWIWVAIFVHGFVDNSLYAKFNTRLYWAMWGITLASLHRNEGKT